MDTPAVSPSLLPGGKPLVGILPELARDPLKLMERAVFEHGPVVQLPLIPGLTSIVLGTPTGVQQVLINNARNYVKRGRGYQELSRLLGNGLVTSEGDFWKRQRRIAQPAFHRERLAHFGQVMVRAAREMVDGWKLGQPFDLAREMSRCTLRVVGETLLSSDVSAESGSVYAALTEAMEFVAARSLTPMHLPTWLPTEKNRGFKRSRQALDTVVLDVIAERRRGGEHPHDLLTMLMEARDPETGEGMNDAQLRDEVMTIFLAGHETTANNLAWTGYLLGQNPSTERAYVTELDAVLGGKEPGMETMRQLPYGANVVKESLRLYPPVWSIIRKTVNDDVIEGKRIPAGALVVLPVWAIHRLPSVWDRPLEFDPTRWQQEDPRRAHGGYLPFSLGQRKCIGDTFANVEAQLILATILQRVRLELVPGQHVVPEPLITLRPHGGVQVVAHARTN